MVAHATGAGGPPPSPPNEVKLLAEIARLSTELAAAQEVVKAANYHLVGAWDHAALRAAIVAYGSLTKDRTP